MTCPDMQTFRKSTSHTSFLRKFSEDMLQQNQDRERHEIKEKWIQHGIREEQSHRLTVL